MTRRRLLVGLGRASLVGLAGLLSACQTWPRPPAPALRPPLASPAARPLDLAIGLPAEPGVEAMPLVHLVQSGFFRSFNLDPRLIWGQVGAEALPDLLAGRVQVAVLDLPTAARAAEQKVDLAGVFQLYPRDPMAVFSLARRPMLGPADLAGQRIGLPIVGSAPRLALRAALRAAGLELERVALEARTGPLGPLLELGEVAALAAPRSLIAALEARALPVRQVPAGGWEQVPGQSVVTTRAFISENRPAVRALVAGLQAGILRLLERPDELRAGALELLAPPPEQRGPLVAQLDQVVGALRGYEPDRGPGWADPERIEQAGGLLRELGVLDGSVPLNQVFVNDLLPRPRP